MVSTVRGMTDVPSFDTMVVIADGMHSSGLTLIAVVAEIDTRRAIGFDEKIHEGGHGRAARPIAPLLNTLPYVDRGAIVGR